MGIYAKYLICYDIEENKVRKKFFDGMKDLGLIPIQKSVFYGDLNNAEFNALKRLATELLDETKDKCLWIKCNLSESGVKECFGYKGFEYDEPDGYKTI
jgi:CRISPR-associated protein Cas2